MLNIIHTYKDGFLNDQTEKIEGIRNRKEAIEFIKNLMKEFLSDKVMEYDYADEGFDVVKTEIVNKNEFKIVTKENGMEFDYIWKIEED